jgi:hypothetical protein
LARKQKPGDLPPHVDCIWASPPRTHCSRAKTRAKTPRDLEGIDALVWMVLSLIDRYGGPDWLMENPESGLMKTREVVAALRAHLDISGLVLRIGDLLNLVR